MRGARKMAQALLSASVLLLGATMSWSQSLIWLGNGHTWAYDVSANGSVVVGKFVVQGTWHAFRWEDGSLMDINNMLGGPRSIAYGVSADGSVVVGEAINSAGRLRAFRWTWQGVEDIGIPNGYSSWAYDVSANGSVIVGYSRTATNAEVAFRWENGEIQLLSGSSYSHAYGVSANGSVVVGDAYVNNHTQAVRWVNGVMEVLGLLPGGVWCEAHGVSANGDVVVGYGSIGGGIHHAFRWENGVMQDLGTLPDGLDSEAYGVSADGSEVVGGAYVNWFYDWRAFRWRNGVMEDLNDTYAYLLTDGSYLRVAYAISPDGRYIVGWGHHAGGAYGEAFLLDTGPRCTSHNGDVDSNGCIDDADLLAVLFAFGCSSGCGREDTNCDGVVDDADLLQVLFNFGQGC